MAYIMVFLAWATFVHGSEYKADIRELCRAEVASALINKKNSVDLLEQNTLVWRQSLRRLKSQRDAVQKDLLPLEKRKEKEIYNRDLEERLSGLKHKILVLDSQIALGEESLSDSKPKLDSAAKSLEKFKKQLTPIFKLKKLDLSKGGGFNYVVSYKHACSKYRYLCPLPEGQRKKLKGLAKELQDPIPCQRYSNVQPE